jgi:hypothetical protein
MEVVRQRAVLDFFPGQSGFNSNYELAPYLEQLHLTEGLV